MILASLPRLLLLSRRAACLLCFRGREKATLIYLPGFDWGQQRRRRRAAREDAEETEEEFDGDIVEQMSWSSQRPPTQTSPSQEQG